MELKPLKLFILAFCVTLGIELVGITLYQHQHHGQQGKTHDFASVVKMIEKAHPNMPFPTSQRHFSTQQYTANIGTGLCVPGNSVVSTVCNSGMYLARFGTNAVTTDQAVQLFVNAGYLAYSGYNIPSSFSKPYITVTVVTIPLFGSYMGFFCTSTDGNAGCQYCNTAYNQLASIFSSFGHWSIYDCSYCSNGASYSTCLTSFYNGGQTSNSGAVVSDDNNKGAGVGVPVGVGVGVGVGVPVAIAAVVGGVVAASAGSGSGAGAGAGAAKGVGAKVPWWHIFAKTCTCCRTLCRCCGNVNDIEDEGTGEFDRRDLELQDQAPPSVFPKGIVYGAPPAPMAPTYPMYYPGTMTTLAPAQPQMFYMGSPTPLGYPGTIIAPPPTPQPSIPVSPQ